MENLITLDCSKAICINNAFNHKTGETIYAGVWNNQTIFRSFLEFEIDYLPQNLNLEKAQLSMYCICNDNMEQDRVIAIHPVLEDWSDINWHKQPAFDTDLKSLFEVDCNYHDTVTIDITDIINTWLEEPGYPHKLMLKAENEEMDQVVGFLKPKLELIYSVPYSQNINNLSKKRIAILTPQFFDWNGNKCLLGGGERFLFDLIKLIKQLGHDVDLYQASIVEDWERTYAGINIKGIATKNSSQDFFAEINKEFYKLTMHYDQHIYFGTSVMGPEIFPEAICICHNASQENTFKQLHKNIKYICTDTGIFSLLSAQNQAESINKVYLPNYVDLKVFKPNRYRNRPKIRGYGRRPKEIFLDKQFVNILYPRRLQDSHGWSVFKEVALEMIGEFKNISFSFVGRGTQEAEKHMEIVSSKYPRIEYLFYEMEDMYKAYQKADIVVIPSLYKQGTSLALLEAMACGKAVIAGLVGGAADYLIDGFNGRLIDINKENLKYSIKELIINRRLRHKFSVNARAVATAFSKERWQDRWINLLEEHFSS